jgi:hypothetical protein
LPSEIEIVADARARLVQGIVDREVDCTLEELEHLGEKLGCCHVSGGQI